MATTTNYSWTTPDDTALVKDGAAAIRSLGTAIDSTVFTNAGAAVTKATVDAKGDLIAGTADNTVARLAVGANDTVLTADSSTATGLKWASAAAGGMTLISSTSLSGSSTTLSSIPATYKDLVLIIRGLTSSDEIYSRLRFNGDSGSNRHKEFQYSSADTTDTAFDNTFFNLSISDSSVANGLWYISIPDYANTTTWKIMNGYGFTNNQTTTTNFHKQTRVGVYNQTGAISSLEIFIGSGTIGGTALLYGVK
jgi:hypothetical protein